MVDIHNMFWKWIKPCKTILVFQVILVQLMASAQQISYKRESLFREADCQYADQKYNLALECYKTIDSIYKDIDKVKKYFVLDRIGKSYYNLGQYGHAAAIFDTIANRYKYQLDEDKLIKNEVLLATSYHFSNQTDKAIKYYEHFLENYINSDKYKLQTADINYYLSSLYKETQRFEEALMCLETAKQLSFELKDEHLLASILGEIGSCFLNQKEYKKAIQNYRESNSLQSELGVRNRTFALNGIALSYQRINRIDSAVYYYQIALENASTLENRCYVMNVKSNLGSLYLSDNQIGKAEHILESAVQHFDSVHDNTSKIKTLQIASELYQKKKDYKKALEFYKLSETYQDSVDQLNNSREFNEFQAKFKTLQKEKEIYQLQIKNSEEQQLRELAEVKRTNTWKLVGILIPIIIIGLWLWWIARKKIWNAEQLNIQDHLIITTEMNERKRIAQDLHDSLGQLISLAKMRASNLEIPTTEKDDLKKLLSILDQSYDELHKISHNIMPETLAKEGLISSLRELALNISKQTNVDVRVLSKIDNSQLDDTQSIALYRIIQELISNAIKHGGATTVQIEIYSSNKKLKFSIADNGKGFNQSVLHSTSRMGWKNIKSRIRVIRGEVQIESKINRGTIVNIQL